LFEHHQWLLEKDADRLHELMEGEALGKMLKIDILANFNDEWKNFKNSVINLCTASVKFQENLLSEIETTMLGLVNYKLFS